MNGYAVYALYEEDRYIDEGTLFQLEKYASHNYLKMLAYYNRYGLLKNRKDEKRKHKAKTVVRTGTKYFDFPKLERRLKYMPDMRQLCCRLRTGRITTPKKSTLEKIAAELHCDIDDLLTETIDDVEAQE